MVNHVVLFKLKNFSAGEKEVILAELKSLLEDLKDKIKEVKFIEVGLNYDVDSKSHDICLLSHFDTMEDLDKYRVHPEHVKVGKRISETCELRAAVDYIF